MFCSDGHKYTVRTIKNKFAFPSEFEIESNSLYSDTFGQTLQNASSELCEGCVKTK